MIDKAYKDWLVDLKNKVRAAQLKAAVAVNRELILLYWDLGKMITEKENIWGSKLIPNLSKDLKAEFPNMEGFSVSNLKYCKRLYLFYHSQIGQQLVAQIPWGHNILIFSKSKDINEALFYIQETIANGWSRNILGLQIENSLFERQGKAIHNFKATLPETTSELAHQLLKDPYSFDFLALTENYKERELENALVENITKFLLELGSGFAYIGKQVLLKVGDEEFFIDLLFYHLKLRAYVVIELKATDFKPEFAGKLSFYLSASNDLLKHPTDNPTIGLMICKNKNNVVAEYALANINHPIGVSEYELTKLFPDEFKSSLPTIEEIESELKDEL